MLIVPESYQNYQNGALRNQLTDGGRERVCWGVTLNLLMCDRRGAVYSVQAITSEKHKYPLIDLFYFNIDCYIFSVLN